MWRTGRGINKERAIGGQRQGREDQYVSDLGLIGIVKGHNDEGIRKQVEDVSRHGKYIIMSSWECQYEMVASIIMNQCTLAKWYLHEIGHEGMSDWIHGAVGEGENMYNIRWRGAIGSPT